MAGYNRSESWSRHSLRSCGMTRVGALVRDDKTKSGDCMRKLLGMLVMCVAVSRAALAQTAEADTPHPVSVFIGPTFTGSAFNLRSPGRNVGIGISRDFADREAAFRPRVTLSYDQWSSSAQTTRVGSLLAEGVLRPKQQVRNVGPYVFGGLGVFSRLPMSSTLVVSGSPTPYHFPSYNYVGWSSGLGVEVGRGFVQFRVITPVGNGIAFSGLNLGYRL